MRHPSCVRVGFVGVVWLRARRGRVTKRQRRSSRPYECPANRHTRFKNPSQELGGQAAFRVGAPHAKHPLRSAVPLPSPDPGRAYGRRGTMMQNTNRAVGTAREQERAYANHRHRRGHRGGGPRRYFLRALPFGAGLHGAHRHGGQRLGGGGSRMPEAGGRAMRELRTLPYHDGVLGRGSVLGRKAVAVGRRRRRPARPHRA